MNKSLFSNLNSRKLFLRYAAPCAEDTENIKEEIRKGKTSLDLGEMFPTAINALKIMAKEKDSEEIDEDQVREYFWFKHAEVLQQNTKDKEKIQKCLVLPGKLLDSNRASLINGEVREVNTDLLNEPIEKDRVTVHYSYVAEKIQQEDEQEIKQYLSSQGLI